MKVLIKDSFSEGALALLKTNSQLKVSQSRQLQLSDTELENAEILLIRSRTKLPQEILEKARQLKFIITATSGFDHIDLDYCKAHNIKVAHTPDANRDSAAELTMMHMLNCMRHSSEAMTAIQNGHWRNVVPRGNTLSGKHLGIVGLGHIGSRVAEMAHCFNMKVSAFDPYQPDEQFEKYNVERIGYTELLIQSNIVTYHVPLTEETRHMVNHQTLDYFLEGAIIINASRGEVIDENELYTALVKKKIAAAGLDVFEKEPLPQASNLRTLPNVFMTTHLGAYTYESISLASRQAVQKVFLFLENKEIPCLLV